MAGIVLEFDRNPNLSEMERLQSFMESVQRAFNELEITHDDLDLANHPVMLSVTQDNQDFKVLFQDYGHFKVVTANAIEAIKGDFKVLYSEMIEADRIVVETLEASYIKADEAVIAKLSGDLADYKVIVAEQLLATDAKIENLDTEYAKIDQTNIGQAWVQDLLVTGKFLADDFNAATGSFSKYLTGVNIVGDNIRAGTISTDRLIIRDPDTNRGILYEINNGAVDQTNLTEDELKRLCVDGKILVAESVTADKINVYDLFAQNIISTGNFNMGGNGALVYDYEKDELTIRVKELVVGNSGRTLEEELDDIRSDKTFITVGARNLIRNSKHLIFDDYCFGHDDFKPFKLKAPVISIDKPKLGRPKISLKTYKLDKPEIYIDAYLDKPEIYLSTDGSGTSAVLGKAVLGQMVLGRDGTSAVLGEAVLGEMELGNGLTQLDTPIIDLVEQLDAPVIELVG